MHDQYVMLTEHDRQDEFRSNGWAVNSLECHHGAHAVLASRPDDYSSFIARKAARANATGIANISGDDLSPHLFDFQRDVTAFCLGLGRAGLFLDTGLGKTFCELEFADRARQETNGRALILTPLAVAQQIKREADRFGYDARVIREQSDVRDGVNICNYDRIDKLDADEFGVIVLDESSILKNFTGKTTRALIRLFADHRFKLAATATPAPNDNMELGNHAEFLSVMAANEMLSRFFINDTGKASQHWRLKKHAERGFWNWMASWSRMAQSPDDLGYDGSSFVLPHLEIIRHKTGGRAKPEFGLLFAQDFSATEIHDIKRQTVADRADAVAGLADNGEPWVIWCDTNYEADALTSRIPDAVDVRGSLSADKKEALLEAFGAGEARVIISKPSICGHGLNWQHCSNMAFVGRSFSYEQWYQAVRRCWRFGQTRPVNVHVIVADGEDQIGRVIDRKADDHATMKAAMSEAMRRSSAQCSDIKIAYQPDYEGSVPRWLK